MADVCVTGASRGIGLGFARAYLAKGDRVFGAVRNLDSEAVIELSAQYSRSFTPVQMDVSNRESVERAAREIAQHTDRLDLLINNAGRALPPQEQRIEDISEADIRSLLEVNTLGPLRVSQELFGLLRASDNPRIVMISSNAGSIASQGGGRGVPYCVSKAALNMLTKLLSFHCAAEGVAIAAIHPGWVATDMGGADGALSVEDSVSRMTELIAVLSTDSPLYVDYTGKEMPW